MPGSRESAMTIITKIGEAITIPGTTINASPAEGFNLSDYWRYPVVTAYLLGVTVLLSRTTIGIFKIERLRKNGRKVRYTGYSVVYIKQRFAPFSFSRTIFINETLTEPSERSSIIDHELQHIKQLHTWDNILVEIFLAIFWFNPFMWFIKRALKNTHEYLADNGIAGSGSGMENYQFLLLKQVQGLSALAVTNTFNSNIKNRIKMMCRRKSTRIAKFKPLLIMPAVLGLALTFAFTYSENKPAVENLALQQQDTLKPLIDTLTVEGEVFFIVEDMPSFQGSGQAGFREWISENLVYPAEAKSKGISGRVYIQFTVDTEGQATDVKVVRGAHPDLDAEAVRVVSSSPAWTPGKQRGENVAVQFTFPIDFKIE
jgi:TonB family protein